MPDEVKPAKQLATTGLGAGILASSVLAAITLAVFYVLQDYGPESALRKYNEAILNLIQDSSSTAGPEDRQAALVKDIGSYDQVSAEPLNDRNSQWLVSLVTNCLRRGGRLRLIAVVNREPANLAVANAVYVLPDNTPAPVLFFISKQDHVWKVDPRQTSDYYNPR